MTRRLNMDSVLAQVATKTGGLPIFQVTSAAALNEEVARVVGKFSKAPKSVEEARIAIAAAFDNKVSAVPESFTKLGKSAYTSAIEVSGFLQVNKEVRSIDRSQIGTNPETARYREMAGNVMMDNVDESLWELSVAESGALSLSRAQNTQLSDLVSMASVKDRQLPEVAATLPMLNVSPDPRNAIYASFFSAETAAVNYGYVVNQDTIFNTDTMSTETAGRGQLISIMQLAGADASRVVPMPVEDDSGDVVEYYSELCKANPEFYIALDNQLSGATVA